MKTQTFRYILLGLVVLPLSFGLVSCENSKETEATSPASPQTEVSPAATEAAANLSEIQNQPVWVKPTDTEEVTGEEGMDLEVGETIRTEGEALAEVDLKNGLAFRIGGDAVLTLEPENQLNLTSGEMITWVEPGQKVPAEIVTPGGVAGIRGTTVFVKIPDDPNEGIVFFSWEGTVAVRLPNQTEEILLESGEEVLVAKGETDLEKIRNSVRQLSQEEWSQRRQESRLLNQFAKPIPTEEEIEKAEERFRS
ncbi:FecR domain-containing protein [Lusitaniella coriacea]|uniref:FecR domain-containing protein n=1 Tax=Lusitaniella coriacea TaxID=1983105 RepID=UPI003CF5784B